MTWPIPSPSAPYAVRTVPDCQCSMHGKGGYHCRTCCLTFTSISAFDGHLGGLLEGAYEHRSPEEAGLVERDDGKVSLPSTGYWGRANV